MGYSKGKWDYKQTATNAAQVRAIKEHLEGAKIERKTGWRIR